MTDIRGIDAPKGRNLRPEFLADGARSNCKETARLSRTRAGPPFQHLLRRQLDMKKMAGIDVSSGSLGVGSQLAFA
jgi:hypothetical protein